MKSRTTRIPIGDRTYEIRRMTPVVGSYIWQRITGAMYKIQRENSAALQDDSPTTEKKSLEVADTISAEDRVKAICAIAFPYLDFDTFKFVQDASLKVVSRVEINAGVEAAMPLVQDNGTWDPRAEDVAADPFLVTRLTVEAVAFSLASFLAPPASTKA